jgi:molybdopterin converting factor small subunit
LTHTVYGINFYTTYPVFDNIKDEPEFQQIVRDVEAKYQAEHERVRKWLEENDML